VINRRKNFTIAVMLTILSVLLFLVALNGCAPADEYVLSLPSSRPGNSISISETIYKFDDDGNTCYVYVSYGISCVP